MAFEQKRWRYLIAAMLLALFSGIGYAWSVFQTPLMTNFHWQLSAISLTFTIQVFVSTVSPVFLGKYKTKLGVANFLRAGIAVYTLGLLGTMFTSSIFYLYVVFGVIVGIGLGMLYPTLMAYSTSLFPDKTGLASGLLACSYGCGAVVWAPTATFFMNSYGVLAVFGLFAGLFAVVMIPLSFLIKAVPADFHPQAAVTDTAKQKKRTGKDYTWQEMMKSSQFYILVLALTLGTTSGLMITGHASNILQEMVHYTAEQAAFLVGLISVFNAFGRLVFGTASDFVGRYNMMLILFAVIALAMFALTQTEGVLFVSALLAISASYGGFAAMISPLCADIFGMKHLSINYNFFYICYGLAGVIGPQLASFIRTTSGGYKLAFWAVAGMSVFGFLLIVLQKVKAPKQAEANV